MIDEVKYGPSTKIADIDFISARLANVLSSIGIKNLSDLKSFVGKNKTESLLKIRNFGHKSLEELRQLVSALETSEVLCGRESCDAWVCSDSQKYDKKAEFASRIANTPIEETMQALVDIVRAGKALYAGISNYPADKQQECYNYLREAHVPCVIGQYKANIAYRETLEQNLPVAQANGSGFICFSPLAQGLLTNRYLNGIPTGSRASMWIL